MLKKQVLVVGSGIGGLSTAIRLANKGYAVDVFEANAYAGGKVSEIVDGDFRFGMGPSLFTMPELLDDLFKSCGKNPNQYYEYLQTDIVTKYFYSDGIILNAYKERKKLLAEFEEKLAEPAENIEKHLNKSKQVYDLTANMFLFSSMHKASTYLNLGALKTLFNLRKLQPFKTMHASNSARFEGSKTVQLFNRYATYNGSDPYKAPATLNVIPHLEFNVGAYFLKGGMIQLSKSLFRLAEDMGVQFHFNSPVDKIEVKEGKVSGIEVRGTKIPADLVVSNMDIYSTYRKLLKTQEQPEKILKQERSTSALIFYWGIKKEFEQLDLHNIFFSDDYKSEFKSLSEDKDVCDDPTVYVYISSKYERSHAPKGKENWFTMINVPHDSGQNWEAIIKRTRSIVLKKLSHCLKEDIEALIETETIIDPKGIEARTSSHLGALYGSSSNNRYAAFLRHPNFSKKIKNLYFCGGSVHPGGGIPLCLSSAKIIEQLVD